LDTLPIRPLWTIGQLTSPWCEVSIPTLDRFYIGGVVYACIGVSAHTRHEHMEYLTVADAVIETDETMFIETAI